MSSKATLFPTRNTFLHTFVRCYGTSSRRVFHFIFLGIRIRRCNRGLVDNVGFLDNERKKLGRLPRTSRKKRGNNATHIKEEAEQDWHARQRRDERTATHEADLPVNPQRSSLTCPEPEVPILH
jgi:hypothetical protein